MEEKINYYEVGKRIRMLRKKRGQESKAYADFLGISASEYSRYENGKRKLSVNIAADNQVSLDYIYLGVPADKEMNDRIKHSLRCLTREQCFDALNYWESYCDAIRKGNVKK